MSSPELKSAAELVQYLRDEGIGDEAVLAAFLAVPRDRFCLPRDRDWAWEDDVLPLPHGATLSQPYVVASMLEALDLEPGERVLDVGSGSGFTTALLHAMGMVVDAVELEPDLVRTSRKTLTELGIKAEVLAGNAWDGSPKMRSYDAILVSAAADHIPPALHRQLAKHGRMVIPVGPREAQSLQLISWAALDAVQDLYPVRFVPLRSRQ